MLGHALHRKLASASYDAVGSVREEVGNVAWARGLDYVSGVDALDFATVAAALERVRPAVVVNALGVIKQRSDAADYWNLIQVNSAFPRKLELLCEQFNCKLIHFSTDCVFSGTKGNYTERDFPDATDWYGMSKYLGETGSHKALTLRTSIIGRGTTPNNSLVDWFLAQRGQVKGFSQAIFSGLPVNEFGDLLAKKLPHGLMEMSGLYQVSAEPISKLALLQLVQKQWGRDDIQINDSLELKIDRSLDSSRFRKQLDYCPAPWPVLIKEMYEFYKD